MFRLHDRVRRRVALAAFVGLCLVPTAGVLGWGIARHLPSHANDEADALGQRFGLGVRLAGVEHPRPRTIRYLGLELVNPENGRTILKCRKLEATWRMAPGPRGVARLTLLLTAVAPELNAAELAEVGRLAQRAIELRMDNAQVDVRWVADEVTLRLGDKDNDKTISLVDTRGGLQTLVAGSQAWCEFRPADSPSPAPARLRLARNRQTDPPHDWFDLDARRIRLPCSLLARGLAPFGDVGNDADFTGYLVAARMADGWQGRIESAQWGGVDLGRLVSDRFEHTLGGAAQVTIRKAWFRQGRIEQVEGAVVAGPGTVSRSLLRAAAEHLGLEVGAEPLTLSQVVAYTQLAFDFTLDGEGLRIAGLGQTGRKAPIMVDARGAVLNATGGACPGGALLRALAPPGAPFVPASRQTDWLARRLPLAKPLEQARRLAPP
ncbi:MAG: hypothetical protein JW809_16860 [Pirellulales bacterium]|nr:hypothetical protein [Pirellulales bacterium]